jgi:hypothetical protein
VAPYVLDASKAAAMYSDVSGLVEYKLTDLLTPNGAGLKASAADTAARTRAAENFMVDVGCGMCGAAKSANQFHVVAPDGTRCFFAMDSMEQKVMSFKPRVKFCACVRNKDQLSQIKFTTMHHMPSTKLRTTHVPPILLEQRLNDERMKEKSRERL